MLSFEITDVGISSLPCLLLNGHSGVMQVPVRRREDNADVGIISCKSHIKGAMQDFCKHR